MKGCAHPAKSRPSGRPLPIFAPSRLSISSILHTDGRVPVFDSKTPLERGTIRDLRISARRDLDDNLREGTIQERLVEDGVHLRGSQRRFSRLLLFCLVVLYSEIWTECIRLLVLIFC